MKSLYDSAWHLPGTAWLVAAAFLLVLAGRAGGPKRAVFAGLTALIALDAWLNGALTPMGGAPAWVSTAVGLGFVLVGDFRYLYLAERLVAPRGALRRAALLTLIVPVLSIPLRVTHVPERVLWLGYEASFVILAAILRRSATRRAGSRPDALAAARALGTFEMVQYGLWVTADVLLLAGLDVGWLVRLVPNTLYYAAFVPFAWWWSGQTRELRDEVTR